MLIDQTYAGTEYNRFRYKNSTHELINQHVARVDDVGTVLAPTKLILNMLKNRDTYVLRCKQRYLLKGGRLRQLYQCFR